MALFTEGFPGSNGDPWDSGRWNNTGGCDIQSGEGRMVSGGSERQPEVKSFSRSDYRWRGKLRIADVSAYQFIGVCFNSESPRDNDETFLMFTPWDGNKVQIVDDVGGSETSLDDTTLALSDGDVAQVIVEIEGADIRVWIWKIGGTALDYTVDPPTLSGTGTRSTGIIWHFCYNGDGGAGDDNRWEDIEIEELAGAVTATISITDPVETVAITASVGAGATIAATDPVETISITALVVPQGTIAVTDPVETITIAATHSVAATISATDPNDTVAITGLVVPQGQIALADPNDTVAISATHGAVVGTIAAEDPNDTVAITALLVPRGAIALDDPNDTAAVVASHGVTATISMTDALETIGIAALLVPRGAIAMTDPNDDVVITAISGTVTYTQIAQFTGARSRAWGRAGRRKSYRRPS